MEIVCIEMLGYKTKGIPYRKVNTFSATIRRWVKRIFFTKAKMHQILFEIKYERFLCSESFYSHIEFVQIAILAVMGL